MDRIQIISRKVFIVTGLMADYCASNGSIMGQGLFEILFFDRRII